MLASSSLLNCSLNTGAEYCRGKVVRLPKATQVFATRQVSIDHAGWTGARAGGHNNWSRPLSEQLVYSFGDGIVERGGNKHGNDVRPRLTHTPDRILDAVGRIRIETGFREKPHNKIAYLAVFVQNDDGFVGSYCAPPFLSSFYPNAVAPLEGLVRRSVSPHSPPTVLRARVLGPIFNVWAVQQWSIAPVNPTPRAALVETKTAQPGDRAAV